MDRSSPPLPDPEPMLPIDPATALLSPPHHHKRPATPVHPFFTPRPRHALSSTTPSAVNSRGRAQLPSPNSSPSFRASKRPRLSSSPIRDVESLDFRKPSRWNLDSDEPQPESQTQRVEPRPRPKNTLGTRLLMRSLGMGAGRSGSSSGYHCADWSAETMNFYSRLDDRCDFSNGNKMVMPFSAKASNHESLVAFGDESGHMQLVDTSIDGNFKTIVKMQIHNEQPIFNICWSPDDLRVATGSGDQCVHIFDVKEQKLLYKLQGHSQSVKQVSYNDWNPALLTSCSRDGSVRIWDTRINGQKYGDADMLKAVITIPDAHSQTGIRRGRDPRDIAVTCAMWGRENHVLTASESNAQMKLWDIRLINHPRREPKPAVVSRVPQYHIDHRGFGINNFTFSPDRTRVYVLCRDMHVYAYALNHLEQGPLHAYWHPRCLPATFYVKSAVSPDGRLLATGSADGIVAMFPTDERYFDQSAYDGFAYTAAEKKASQHLKVGRGAVLVGGHHKEVTDVTWTKDGDLVSISDGYDGRIWRNGHPSKAEALREGNEHGERWRCGWAEKL